MFIAEKFILAVLHGENMEDEKGFQIKIFNLSDGEYIKTYRKKFDLKVWALNVDENLIAFIQDGEIFVEDYFSGNIITTISTKENKNNSDRVNLFVSCSSEDTNISILIFETEENVEIYKINLEGKVSLCVGLLKKEKGDAINSIECSYEHNIVIFGGIHSNVYIWDYQERRLVSDISLNFECVGMQISNVYNLSVPMLIWLKNRGAHGWPIMSLEVAIQAVLHLGMQTNISAAAKNKMSELSTLVHQQFDIESPLVKYFDSRAFLSLEESDFSADDMKYLTVFVDELNWAKYPRISQLFNETLECL